MSTVSQDINGRVAQKPFIFVIGFAKAGSTSMNDFLQATGHVSTPFPKELKFFNEHFQRGLEWYWSHFNADKEVFADCTPSYHRSTETLARIQSASKKNAIVLMVRNPIERAYSAFVHKIYWHIKAAISAGNLDEFNKTFGDLIEEKAPSILLSYRSGIERAIGIFGKRVLPIPIERFAAQPRRFVNLIGAELGIKIEVPNGVAVPRSNSLTMPQFFLGRDLLDKHEYAKQLIKEPDAVYLCRGGMPSRVADKELYPDLKAIEAKWFEPVSESVLRHVLETYGEKETLFLERKYKYKLDEWREFKVPVPRTAEPFTNNPELRSVELAIWEAQERFRAGDKGGAIDQMRLATGRYPTKVPYLQTLASMLLTNREFDEADRVARDALALAPAATEAISLQQRVIKNRAAGSMRRIDARSI